MNYKKLYNDYVQKYKSTKDYIEKYGETFEDTQMLTKDVFKTSYLQKKKQIEDVLGRKVSDKDAIKEIVNEQRFGGTLAQTKALRDAMKKQGYDVTYSELRKWGGVSPENVTNQKVKSFWNDVDQRRREYIATHPLASVADVSKYIAIVMFGS